MNLRRTLSVTKRIFVGLRNDWRALGMMFLAPIVSVLVFGVAFGGDIRDVEVVVVNQDQGYQIPPSVVPVSLANAIIANIDAEMLTISRVATEAEARERVQSGKAYGLIVFPSNFTRDVYEKSLDPFLPTDPKIRVELDKSNVTVANGIASALSDALLKASGALGIEAPLSLDASTAVYAQDAKFRDFYVPGIIAFSVFILTFILTLLAFVSERTSGTLERLRVTPLTESELVIGYALAYSVVAVVQTAMIMVTVIAVFDILIVGSVFLAFLAFVLLAILSLSLGILLSSLASHEAQAIQFMPIVALPVMLLGGIFWPVESIPTWMRPLTYGMPINYGVDATRSVMLRGWGIGDIWLELTVMCGFTIVFLLLSVISLKRSRG